MKILYMKYWLIVSVCFVLFLLGPNTCADVSPSISDLLDKQRSNYIKAMQTQNSRLMSQYYASDVRLMPEANPTIMQKENALIYFNAFFQRFDIKRYNREKIEVLDMGRFISEMGQFELEMTNSHNSPRLLKGHYMNLFEKQQDGQLLLSADIWNYSHGIDFRDELTFAVVPSKRMALEAHVPVKSATEFELAAYMVLMDDIIPRRNGDIWAQFFSDEAINISQYHPLVSGRAQLDDYVKKHVMEIPSLEKLQNRSDRIEDLGKYVIQFGTGIAFWQSGDNSGVSTAKHLRIWRREAQGGLKIYRSIGAYDQ
jgi:ketosteroid isomerase-like protein